ncbi:MAG: hypothetical protein PHY56_01010 [Candidatus Omnitrophica bacterium]|nr:hypothetical protein [Candidatus Omnitrophota bacterium]
MSIKLHPFKDILKMAKEAIDDSLAPIRANKAKKQAELEVAKMEEQMASQEAKVYEICSKKELDFNALIEAQDQYALMERRKNQFIKIIDELFPKE